MDRHDAALAERAAQLLRRGRDAPLVFDEEHHHPALRAPDHLARRAQHVAAAHNVDREAVRRRLRVLADDVQVAAAERHLELCQVFRRDGGREQQRVHSVGQKPQLAHCLQHVGEVAAEVALRDGQVALVQHDRGERVAASEPEQVRAAVVVHALRLHDEHAARQARGDRHAAHVARHGHAERAQLRLDGEQLRQQRREQHDRLAPFSRGGTLTWY